MAKYPDFGARFRRLCEEAGLPETQVALGKALGVSGGFVSELRDGKKLPSMGKAIEWATGKLGCSVEYLLTGRESGPPLSPGALELARMYEQCPAEERETMMRVARLAFQAALANEAEKRRGARGDGKQGDSVRGNGRTTGEPIEPAT